MSTSDALLERHARPVPRYTSYPTANHFSGEIRPLQYIDWLSALSETTPLSLYLHIPFCRSLCWYCACSTKATRRREPVARYASALATEIRNVACLLPGRLPLRHLHWGGGSPNMLEPADIQRLSATIRRCFSLETGAEHAVEIDPRELAPEQVEAFAEAGVNRVSLGVQDFDPAVQKAIGREQNVALTERAVGLFRARGVASVNIDLVYGLPLQTEASLGRTLERVLALAPDRIAVFGYAHLPERVKPQRLIDEAALPGARERFAQSQLIVDTLLAAGFRRIGLDHFAREADSLARSGLRRNFQGYTSDAAETLLGFGASAIGKLPDGYVQNAVAAHDYERRIARDGLATVRGIALTPDDRMRAWVIERLMCDFSLSGTALLERFGEDARPLLALGRDLLERDTDGLLAATGDGFELTERGRPFVRSICSEFDRYFAARPGRHSSAI